jgi:uncharacterized protein YlxP (DUF503 family)
MFVGSVVVRLLIRESRSLKDKRQVVRSIKDRLRNQFNVAIAEVDALDQRQLAVLGIATVANESAAVRTVLQQIVDALRRHPVAEFLGHEMEIR